MTELFPYQVEGAKFLAERGRALLADDMGLGKTAQAIRAARAVDARSIVVVCPASLVENWRREFKQFWPEFEGLLWVASYARVNTAEEWGGVDVLILDEAHYLKNHKAKRTQAVYGINGKGGVIDRFRYVFCLTGTPTPNHPGEIWTMARAVFPEAILSPAGKPMSRSSFEARYCRQTFNGFGWNIVGGKNILELKGRLAPYVMRRKKEEVLKDLPPIRFDLLPVHADKWGWKSAEEDEIRKVLAEKGVAGLAEIAPHVASLRRVTGMAKAGPVVEWVKDWLEGGGKKIVLFAHHQDVMNAIEEGLAGSGIVRVDGTMSPGLRQKAVDLFQSNPMCRVFIGQIQAAGTGITLTAASDLLFVETSWVPAENQQAAMRIHRISQRNACTVRVATLAGSIDEDIQAAVQRKLTDIKALFG